MGKKQRGVLAVDCETNKFLYGRVPKPFIWGAYDGAQYKHWRETSEFVAWLKTQNVIAYAHNGGRFDWIYLIPYIDDITNVRIIGGRIAEIKFGRAVLRDSMSIIPEALGKIEKDEVNYDLFEEDIREQYMDDIIIPYLNKDLLVLYTLVTIYREEAGKAITIASNAMTSCKQLGVNPGRTNFRFDQRFRPFYFGGRTECFQPGTHRDLCVYDIRSSYPRAMTQLHPTGSGFDELPSLDEIPPENIGRSFIHLQCYSAGAFPLRTENGLSFPHCFGEFYVSGWEYLTAKKYDLIKNVTIKTVFHFHAEIHFSDYVMKWYAYKELHRPRQTLSQKAQYTIGKIMMNSLYGKLAMNPLRYFDYKICDPGTPVEIEEGWELYTSFQSKELHRRSVAWNYEYKHGKEWVKKPLFYNVATGASITGLARANLLDGIMRAGRERVIYCDTDSMVLKGFEAPPVDLSANLGAWDCEGTAELGYFGGKKLYAMRMRERDKDTGRQKIKMACKGSRLDFDHMLGKVRPEHGFDTIERIVRDGETVEWCNHAPTFSISRTGDLTNDVDTGKLFIKRNIRATSPVHT